LSFRSTGRCATWVIAPAPMMAVRRVSLIAGSLGRRSIEPVEGGRRIIRREDLLVTLPFAGAADGAPLAESDARPALPSMASRLTLPASDCAVISNAVLRRTADTSRKTLRICCPVMSRPGGRAGPGPPPPARRRFAGSPDVHSPDRRPRVDADHFGAACGAAASRSALFFCSRHRSGRQPAVGASPLASTSWKERR
jgi:hypothetical protein